jgi:hypothetical protein
MIGSLADVFIGLLALATNPPFQTSGTRSGL